MNNTTKLVAGIIAILAIGGALAGVYYINTTNDTINTANNNIMKHDTQPQHNQNDAMREHCQTMPDMPGCEQYITSGSINHSGHMMNHADMVQSEFDFIYLMIPHHQEAVDTTKALLKITKNPDLIKLGQGIVDGQTSEVAMMKDRIKTQYPSITYQGMGYMPMMRPTTGLSSEQIDTQWTADMIAHHQGAVDMARKVLKIMDAKDPLINATGTQLEFRTSLRTFANNIIATQQKEIQTMKQILSK